ncbi:hypothetical protein ACTFIR_007188 [Dictyostelium discoideum]
MKNLKENLEENKIVKSIIRNFLLDNENILDNEEVMEELIEQIPDFLDELHFREIPIDGKFLNDNFICSTCHRLLSKKRENNRLKNFKIQKSNMIEMENQNFKIQKSNMIENGKACKNVGKKYEKEMEEIKKYCTSNTDKLAIYYN